ncbi:MAG: 30S ribosomal protein S13 [Candidatus Micrarchaeia archaeon]
MEKGKTVGKESPSEIRGIVRIAGKDIKGTMRLTRALYQIKGIGIRLSRILADVAIREMRLPEDVMLGQLTEEQSDRLEEICMHPERYVPPYLLNRQKDIETGESIHLIGSDLTFRVKQDIEKEKEILSWRGFRHTYGKKVRGQRTRTTGRKGMTVGVIRRAVAPKPGAAEKKEEKKEKK